MYFLYLNVFIHPGHDEVALVELGQLDWFKP